MAVSIHFRHSLQRFGAGRWTINRGNASNLELRRYPGSNWLSLYGYWLMLSAHKLQCSTSLSFIKKAFLCQDNYFYVASIF